MTTGKVNEHSFFEAIQGASSQQLKKNQPSTIYSPSSLGAERSLSAFKSEHPVVNNTMQGTAKSELVKLKSASLTSSVSDLNAAALSEQEQATGALKQLNLAALSYLQNNDGTSFKESLQKAIQNFPKSYAKTLSILKRAVDFTGNDFSGFAEKISLVSPKAYIDEGLANLLSADVEVLKAQPTLEKLNAVSLQFLGGEINPEEYATQAKLLIKTLPEDYASHLSIYLQTSDLSNLQKLAKAIPALMLSYTSDDLNTKLEGVQKTMEDIKNLSLNYGKKAISAEDFSRQLLALVTELPPDYAQSKTTLLNMYGDGNPGKLSNFPNTLSEFHFDAGNGYKSTADDHLQYALALASTRANMKQNIAFQSVKAMNKSMENIKKINRESEG